jgi:hypothetical protein
VDQAIGDEILKSLPYRVAADAVFLAQLGLGRQALAIPEAPLLYGGAEGRRKPAVSRHFTLRMLHLSATHKVVGLGSDLGLVASR